MTDKEWDDKGRAQFIESMRTPYERQQLQQIAASEAYNARMMRRGRWVAYIFTAILATVLLFS